MSLGGLQVWDVSAFAGRRHRRIQQIAVCFMAAILTATLGAQEVPKSPVIDAGTATAASEFKIPDGTPVQLRFAQSVHGITRIRSHTRVYSKPGDKVRLVVAEDVLVNGLVAICKGASGQATVTKTDTPTRVAANSYDRSALAADLVADLFLPQTGSVYLHLDWIEDMIGHRVPLRASSTGEAKPFIVVVESGNGGLTARPPKLARDLKTLAKMHLREWAPSGTRIFAFVHGEVGLDSAELQQTQALLPIRNTKAMLMIYRMKGHKTDNSELSCDDKTVGPVAEKQYVTLELKPGKHACRAGNTQPVEITAEAGEEYFLHLQRRTLADTWELKPVTTAEGEDSIVDLEETASKP
jgi:hypothetical protein